MNDHKKNTNLTREVSKRRRQQFATVVSLFRRGCDVIAATDDVRRAETAARALAEGGQFWRELDFMSRLFARWPPDPIDVSDDATLLDRLCVGGRSCCSERLCACACAVTRPTALSCDNFRCVLLACAGVVLSTLPVPLFLRTCALTCPLDAQHCAASVFVALAAGDMEAACAPGLVFPELDDVTGRSLRASTGGLPSSSLIGSISSTSLLF